MITGFMKKSGVFFLVFLLMLTMVSKKIYAEEDYSDYSNENIHFGLGLNDEHKRPGGDEPSGVKLSDYDTYYYDETAYENNDKVIYFTFDCGYENGNTPSILDTLSEYGIKAIFFVTTPYVKENPDLVKRMKEEGHLVGNHTTTHPSLPECSVSKIKKEMNTCKDTMKELTGYDIDPYMRPPMGHYSVRTMKVMQDLGYSTMLWSLAIYDYEENDQPGADYVVKMFKKYHFCGMMPLLHVISSSDTEALPEVIETLQEKGYRFGLVSEFASGGTSIEIDTEDEADEAEEVDEGQDPKEAENVEIAKEQPGNRIKLSPRKVNKIINRTMTRSVTAFIKSINQSAEKD
jgi:peptidoglycan-N-acetylmuramic acid deacetylase